MSADIDIAHDGPLLRITLSRPAKKNALTGAMYEAMSTALAEATADAGVRAVLLSGSPGVFTAGNDIGDFLASPDSFTDFPAMGFIRALVANEKPLVAAVDGLAVGIGTTLLLHCDLVYASPSALFRLPFVDLGLVPEAGSSLLLPLRVGMARASEFLLLGDAFGAEDALRLGLVNALIEPDALLDHAKAQALRLAAQPPGALAAARRLIRGDQADLSARITQEEAAFAAALKGAEARERLAALQAKVSQGKPRPDRQ